MKCLTALLMLAPFLLLPASAAGVQDGTETTQQVLPDVSPDGVALHDYAQDSLVWGRIFRFDAPAGVAEHEVPSLCPFEDKAEHWACLASYIVSVRWAPPGTPGAWELVGPDTPLPELPSVGGGSVVDAWVVFRTDDFVIHDNIDCTPLCNKDAEPYVKFTAWTSGGYSTSPAYTCTTQGASSGTCGQSAGNWFQVVAVGPNSCAGIVGMVNFYDEDGVNDDQMDISSRLGDAEASIEAVLPAGSSPCNLEDNQWWSERGNFDSTSGYRCHAVAEATYCYLNGDGDTAGDNDDASLDFTVDW